MKLKKLPLAERIQRSKDGQLAYPEYYSAVISRQGEMPVSDYLSGLDAGVQARFQRLIPLSDSLTFQQAAQIIGNIYEFHPALAADAMRILAAPMMRYEDQLRARDASEVGEQVDLDSASEDGEPMVEEDLEMDLLDIMPVEEDEDEDSPRAVQKLPLAVRLRQITMKLETAARLPIYDLYVRPFFLGIGELLGSSGRYSAAFNKVLVPYLERYEEMPALSSFIADSRELSDEEQTRLLYQTLIKPFTELQNKKERSNYQCISLPF